jgi:Tfp pilus assembly protein PilF
MVRLQICRFVIQNFFLFLVGSLLLFTSVSNVSGQVFGSRSNTGGTGGRNTIHGKVLLPSNNPAVEFRVLLESPNSSTLSTFTDSNGAFYFNSLEAGNYTVIVEVKDQYESVRENITIDRESISATSIQTARSVPVMIYLRSKGTAQSKPGVINASLAAVPKPALEKFEKGLEFAAKNETSKAVSQFEEAIKLHPQFAEAHSELGSALLKQGKLDQAETALRKVLELNPKLVNARLDLGIALLNKRQMAEAEKELREVIKANETFATPHMYLGIALMGLKQWEEAEKELLRAISLKDDEKIAQAHKYLGGLYMGYKKNSQAIEHLEKYLKLAPKASDAEKIRATIKQLREQN